MGCEYLKRTTRPVNRVQSQGKATTMKISVDIDCTPEEARQFLGLPDVRPMQDAVMAQLQEQLQSNLKAMEPEALMKTWLPVSLQGWEQLQRMFWSQMGKPPGGDKSGS